MTNISENTEHFDSNSVKLESSLEAQDASGNEEDEGHRLGELPANSVVSPVYRLPADNLLDIFFLLVHSSAPQSVTLLPSTPWDWVAVTKVCAFWRSIALQCPGLWANILQFKHLERLRVFLKRSDTVNLYINIGLPMDWDTSFAAEFIDLLEKHMWRVRAFVVTSHGFTIPPWDKYIKCLSAASARLKVLDLGKFGVTSRKLLDFQDINPAIRLESLSLHGMGLEWASSSLAGLTELTLEYLEESFSPNIFQLLSTLEQSPRLRYLKLRNIWRNTGSHDGIPYRYRAVNLPHMKRISLLNTPLHIFSELSRCVKVPNAAIREFSITNYPFKAPLSSHVGFLQGLEAAHALSIRFFGAFLGEVNIMANPGWSGRNFTYDVSTSYELEFSQLTAEEVQIRDIVGSVVTNLHDPFFTKATDISISFDLYTLQVDIIWAMDETIWTGLFNVLSKDIKKLIITMPICGEKECKNGLIEAFSSKIHSEEQAQYRFPELEVLKIIHADFSGDEGNALFGRLSDHIEDRNRDGKSTCKVSFVACKGIDAETAETGYLKSGNAS